MTNPFLPTPFATPVINPTTASLFRRTPYLSPSEYQFAPTAVSTSALVAKSADQVSDTLASLAQVISRASSWMDQYCFHTADGTLAASVTTEASWLKAKPNGSLAFICNYKPVLEVVGLGLGPTPSQVADVTSTVSGNIWIQGKVVYIPGSTTSGTTNNFAVRSTGFGDSYAVLSYVNGFPHTALTGTTYAAGVSSITVAPSTPDQTTVAGVYAGTQLTIHDGANTEAVVVSTTPTGLTLALSAPTAYAHEVPANPDSIRVSALPWAVEQACISITSCLLKTRGTRAFILPGAAGQAPNKQALAQAGALEDYEIAAELLDPFVTVYQAH